MHGALLNKPQRLTTVEDALMGKVFDDASMQSAMQALENIIEESIGGRWSAVYKKPVFLNIFRDQMNRARTQITN